VVGLTAALQAAGGGTVALERAGRGRLRSRRRVRRGSQVRHRREVLAPLQVALQGPHGQLPLKRVHRIEFGRVHRVVQETGHPFEPWAMRSFDARLVGISSAATG
jgi:hypothetical protein